MGTSNNITEGITIKFLVGVYKDADLQQPRRRPSQACKNIFMHTELPALLIAVDDDDNDDDGRVSVLACHALTISAWSSM